MRARSQFAHVLFPAGSACRSQTACLPDDCLCAATIACAWRRLLLSILDTPTAHHNHRPQPTRCTSHRTFDYTEHAPTTTILNAPRPHTTRPTRRHTQRAFGLYNTARFRLVQHEHDARGDAYTVPIPCVSSSLSVCFYRRGLLRSPSLLSSYLLLLVVRCFYPLQSDTIAGVAS